MEARFGMGYDCESHYVVSFLAMLVIAFLSIIDHSVILVIRSAVYEAKAIRCRRIVLLPIFFGNYCQIIQEYWIFN